MKVQKHMKDSNGEVLNASIGFKRDVVLIEYTLLDDDHLCDHLCKSNCIVKMAANI